VSQETAPQPDPAAAAVQRASMLADVGRYDDALQTVDEALGSFPDDARLLLVEGWLLLKLGRAAEAREVLAAVVASQPNQAWGMHLLSFAEAMLDNLPAARTAADRALELEPNAARYHLRVGYFAAQAPVSKADRALAHEQIASALELEPDAPATLLSAAEISRDLGEIEQAKEYVARGLAQAPEDQDLHYFRAVLAGEYTPTGPRDYGGLVHAANQVTALGEVLGMAPGNVEAGQVLFGRVWGQLLRLVDTPLIMIAVVALSIGWFMGSGPSLHNIYWGAGFAVLWPIFRLITTRTVLSRAPKGYLRRMTHGGADARLRLTGSFATLGVGVVGVLSLLWLREASLVRWLLLLLVLASIVGAAASVLWYRRYFDAAIESGIFAPTDLGFRSAKLARKSIAQSLGWRAFVLLVAGIPAAMMGSLTRADAAPVFLLAVVAWVSPLVYALWRTRVIASRLADEDHAPPGVRPSVVGGPVAGFVSLAIAAVAVLTVAQAPWLPSDRDVAETYVQIDSTSDLYDDCQGRPASRLACVIDKNQERIDEITEDLEQIEVPEFEVPDIDIPEITVPTFTSPPPVVAP
jgi:hypothetical protein